MADEQQNVTLNPTNELNRRQFFAKLGLGSLSIAAVGTAAFAYQYLEPNVLYEPSPVVNAGKPDRYPLGSVTHRRELGDLHHSLARGLLLAERGLHASGLHDRVESRSRIRSPVLVTAASSSRTVRKIEGPAPKPLPWKRIWLNDDGDLLVDRSTDVLPLARDSFVRV